MLCYIMQMLAKYMLIASAHTRIHNSYKNHGHMGETFIGLTYISQPSVVQQYLLQNESSNLTKIERENGHLCVLSKEKDQI